MIRKLYLLLSVFLTIETIKCQSPCTVSNSDEAQGLMATCSGIMSIAELTGLGKKEEELECN